MGHSSVKVTERYSRLNRKRLHQDFPDLFPELKLDEKTPEMALRDTKSRDTNAFSSYVFRG